MRKMKDSGIEWIGDIPEEWETRGFRHIFQLNKGLTITRGELSEEGIPCINYGEIHSKYGFDFDISRDALLCVDLNLINNNKNSIVNDGDFIFCDTSEDIEGSGNYVYIRKSDAQKIFAGSHTIIARPVINLSSRYFAYLFATDAWRAQIRSVVYGVKVFSITQSILKATKAIIPPIKEQIHIVYYLDNKCAQIDSIIDAKEKTNEKLKEYRQSIIYEAVTKGLNKNAPMKDSGVEWIGVIPEGWEIKKLKYISDINKNRLSESTDPEFQFNYIDISSIIETGIISDTQVMEFSMSPSRARMIVDNGDIIVSTVRTYLKAIAQIKKDNKYICSTGFCIISPKNIIKEYVYYLCISEYFIQKIVSKSVGVSYPAISSSEISNIKAIIPPINEQQQIVDHLDAKCSQIDSVISANEKTIEKLKEYRQSIIYEAVTGKIEI